MQSSLKSFWKKEEDDAPCVFIDLFCGAGGASTGARQAGYSVQLAVDANPIFLEAHAANHPGCRHLLATLPAELPLPTSGKWHLHASPPCQKVSKGNQERNTDDRDDALALIEWCVRLALTSGCSSWSLEQVAVSRVCELLERLCVESNSKFSWIVIDCRELGIPQQHRRRVIAGSSSVVANLIRVYGWRRSVKDVIPFPRGTHLRSYLINSRPRPDPSGKKKWLYKKYSIDEACRSIDKQANTVIAGQWQRWVSPGSGNPPVLFNVEEQAALQTFPKDYVFPLDRCMARTSIGNALPPVVAFQMLTGRRPAGY